MKRLVRRYWAIMLGVGLLGALGSSSWLLWPGSTGEITQGQEPPPDPYPELNAIAAGRIAELRRDLGLDNDALVGLNVTDAQVEQILALARTSAIDREAEITALQVAIGQEKGALREVRRKIRIGPRDEAVIASLPTLERNLAAAEGQYEQFLGGLRQQVDGILDGAQRAQWAVLRNNAGLRLPDRLLALSDEQRVELLRAKRRQRRRRAVAQDAPGRAAAAASHQAERAAVLSPGHQQVLVAFQQTAPAASERVVQAVNKVLPVEEELDRLLGPEPVGVQ